MNRTRLFALVASLSLGGCDGPFGGMGLSVTGAGTDQTDMADMAVMPGPADLAFSAMVPADLSVPNAPADLTAPQTDGGICAGPACNECVDKLLASFLQGQAPPSVKSLGSLSADPQATPILQFDKAVPFVHVHLTSGGSFAAKAADFRPYLRIYAASKGAPLQLLQDVHSTQNMTNHEWYAEAAPLPAGTYEMVITSEANALACPNGAGSQGTYVIAFR